MKEPKEEKEDRGREEEVEAAALERMARIEGMANARCSDLEMS